MDASREFGAVRAVWQDEYEVAPAPVTAPVTAPIIARVKCAREPSREIIEPPSEVRAPSRHRMVTRTDVGYSATVVRSYRDDNSSESSDTESSEFTDSETSDDDDARCARRKRATKKGRDSAPIVILPRRIEDRRKTQRYSRRIPVTQSILYKWQYSPVDSVDARRTILTEACRAHGTQCIALSLQRTITRVHASDPRHRVMLDDLLFINSRHL